MVEHAILARVLHVAGVVLWIGGVAFVTTVLLPSVRRMKSPEERVQFFEAVEGRLNVSVFFVEAQATISGAACHLSDGDLIMVNRNEVSFRRNFDLGHELFHIMTWEEMPPEKNDAILWPSDAGAVTKASAVISTGVNSGKWRAMTVMKSLAPRTNVVETVPWT